LKKLLFLIFALFLINAHAAITHCGTSLSRNDTTLVLFVNGITNTSAEACNSSDELRKAIGTTNFDYSYLYNKADGFISDTDELRAQAKLSDDAFRKFNLTRGDLDYLANSTNTKFQYYAALGAAYESYSNTQDAVYKRIYTVSNSLRDSLVVYAKYYDKIIIVPHSQGNFYTESAFAMLVNSGDFTTVNKIKVVGVASVAATTPSDTYLTNSGDVTVYGGQGFINSLLGWLSVYKPLTSKDSYNYAGTAFTIDQRLIDTSGFHSFNKVYLSDLYYSSEKENKSYRLIIKEYIQALLPSTNTGINKNGTGTITAIFDGASYTFTNFTIKIMTSFNSGAAWYPQFVADDGAGNQIELAYCAIDIASQASTDFCNSSSPRRFFLGFKKASGAYYSMSAGGFQTNTPHSQAKSKGTFIGNGLIPSAATGGSPKNITGNFDISNISIIPY
jgi:hypothetical protein